MQSVRLLIVSPTQAAKRLYEYLFRPYVEQGLSVQYTFTATSALEVLRSVDDSGERPNLILLTSDLPIDLPCEFIRSVREYPELHAIPIVVMTDTLPASALKALYSAGANIVVSTPTTLDAAERAIESFARVWLKFAYLPFPGPNGTEAWARR